MANETEMLEYKEIATDDINKSVIAFANTDGGVILLGVDKSGQEAPLADIDDTYTRITNSIRDTIAPDVTLFVKYSLANNGVIRIEVSEGAHKPYYIKTKGLKPSGVYIRHGASSVPASPEQIRQMIKDADGDVYEELRSLEQALTFDYCTKAFSARDIEFGEEKYIVLGMRGHVQGLYTNLALLLSDQCPHSIKTAVFADEQNTAFRDRKEFTGSVFKQMDDAFAYLQLCNQNRSVINGLIRTDYWDYPQDAIREALINAIIHRDYSLSGSIIINVNMERMEFISLGGLLPGLLPEDIRNGISQLRNQNLAKVFQRLNLIESYGTGIRRIFALYADCPEKPDIIVTPNTFRITLPNRNAVKVENPSTMFTTPQMWKLMDCIYRNPEITGSELQEALGIKRSRLFSLVKQMEEAGLIRISGRGKNKRYVKAE
ncbi:MAG: putative DNA binding domain-containing protein [Peptococcaceae bacterium]|jgi:ATP-dependent DNA helicase RecG|nr:putative DNA binding domain-containing protein [Peptococcaceae bacterium]